MSKRRLVKSGASSFNIALPIEWVRKHKLEKGSEVIVEENELGDIVFHAPNERSFIPQSHYTLKVTKENSSMLYWELLRAYLHNYATINLEGENISQMTASVLQKLNNFIGLDIIEQTKNVIVLKNFSAYDTESSPYSLLKKIDVGVRAMLELIDTFFSKGFSHEEVIELQSQHEYNERIYLFTLKLINAIMDAPALMRTFKTDYRQLMKELAIVSALEQISFQLSKIGRLLLIMENTGKKAIVIKEIFETLSQKYKTVVSLPKNPLSKELLAILEQSKGQVSKWESNLKDVKNQSLMELVAYSVAINSILDQLTLGLMN